MTEVLQAIKDTPAWDIYKKYRGFFSSLKNTPLYEFFHKQDTTGYRARLADLDKVGKTGSQSLDLTRWWMLDKVYRLVTLQPSIQQFKGMTGSGKSTAMIADGLQSCVLAGQKLNLGNVFDNEFNMWDEIIKLTHPYGTVFFQDEGDTSLAGIGTMAMKFKVLDLEKRIRGLGYVIERASPSQLWSMSHYTYETYGQVRNPENIMQVDVVQVLVHDCNKRFRGIINIPRPPLKVLDLYFNYLKRDMLSKENLTGSTVLGKMLVLARKVAEEEEFQECRNFSTRYAYVLQHPDAGMFTAKSQAKFIIDNAVAIREKRKLLEKAKETLDKMKEKASKKLGDMDSQDDVQKVIT